MCGRVRLPNDYSEIRIELGLDDFAPAPNWRPSWNIPPTRDVLAVRLDGEPGRRTPKILHWGLIPPWSKEGKMVYATFNARAETVQTAKSFRGAWKAGRRCLVVTDGFYEWRKGDKQPFLIKRQAGLTLMAGLWEVWRSPDGEAISSCTVITTTANEAVATVHDRMPVILEPASWPLWLGETAADNETLAALLAPCPAEILQMWPVDRRVGNTRNDDPSLSDPLQAVSGTLL